MLPRLIGYIIDNIDFIKSVSLIYIFINLIHYLYNYNLSVRQHIQENKEIHRMVKEIHSRTLKIKS